MKAVIIAIVGGNSTVLTVESASAEAFHSMVMFLESLQDYHPRVESTRLAVVSR